MHSSLLLGALMAIGAAAVPMEERAIKIIDVVDYTTVYVTKGQPGPTQAPVPAAAAQGGSMLQHPEPAAPKPVPAAPKPQPIVSKPKPVPAPAPSSPSTTMPSSGSGACIPGPVPGNADDPAHMLEVVKKWRACYHLQTQNWNPDVQGNAQQVGQHGYGHEEIHELIPGVAMGQCITPGQVNPHGPNQGYSGFELAYIGWLCEVSTDEQLQPENNGGCDVCQVVQDVLHMEYKDRGHHDILVNDEYNGCACAYTADQSANQVTATYQGLFVCNFTP